LSDKIDQMKDYYWIKTDEILNIREWANNPLTDEEIVSLNQYFFNNKVDFDKSLFIKTKKNDEKKQDGGSNEWTKKQSIPSWDWEKPESDKKTTWQ